MKTISKHLAIVLFANLLFAALAAADVRHEINFPDILNYKTLKCDLHTHTVFSDGSVWPPVRIDEAWREGLDVIAITDHIEYQPHKKDIPTNHSRPYEIALAQAKQKNILLIKGAEITRDTPPGHFNAIFLSDITPLDTNDLEDVMKAANQQGAFVWWNHPGWKPEAKGWLDIHTKLYENKWLHGIEIANGDTYYADAHKWAIEKNLTILGNSDIHAPVDSSQTSPENHRTITLVFATEKTTEALKEAIIKGRTAVWCKHQLFGAKQYLEALFNASVRVGKPHSRQNDTVWFEIRNTSPMDIQIEELGAGTAKSVTLPAGATLVHRAKAPKDAELIKLSCRVRNFLVAPGGALVVSLAIPLQ